ncbi:MAG: GNAT family N-acetyltransferase [Pseudomonas sp.]|nr:GNAT family N-acetyltransferase [Pseudomonas sp.]
MASPADIQVFRADEEDAEAIAAIHARSREAAYRSLDEAARGREPNPVERAGIWRELLAGDGETAFTLVAERSEKAVGFCSVSTTSRDADRAPGTGEIAALYVDPPRWGSGVGSALVTKALAELAEAGCGIVTLWTLAENEAALRFYARFGLVPDGFGGPDPRTGRPKARLRVAL